MLKAVSRVIKIKTFNYLIRAVKKDDHMLEHPEGCWDLVGETPTVIGQSAGNYYI